MLLFSNLYHTLTNLEFYLVIGDDLPELLRNSGFTLFAKF